MKASGDNNGSSGNAAFPHLFRNRRLTSTELDVHMAGSGGNLLSQNSGNGIATVGKGSALSERGIFLPFSASPRFRSSSIHSNSGNNGRARNGTIPAVSNLNLNSPLLGALGSPNLAHASGKMAPSTGTAAARRKSSDVSSLDWNSLLLSGTETETNKENLAVTQKISNAEPQNEKNANLTETEGGSSLSSSDFYAQQVFKAKRDVLATLLENTKDVLSEFFDWTSDPAHEDQAVKHPMHSADPPPYDDPQAPALQVLVDPKTASAETIPSKIFAASLADLGAMHDRLLDPSSKVLVTGDINAGKSTLINSLLQREILWTDQQPSTQTFTEIVSAESNNRGVEEVHAVHFGEGNQYSANDPKTYTRFELDHLPAISGFPRLRAYCNDASESRLLSNGIVDLQLIDSPGLNRHSTHTTAIFARQKLIDAVVFVVNAENHFTQSATEFLGSTSKEKPLVFVVVNKFDAIRDQQRCQNEILAQLRTISPMTYEHADELVHFVSARLGGNSFEHLQSQLKGFLLERRSFSKLAPTKLLLENILGDIVTICKHNLQEARREMGEAAAQTARVAPELEKLRVEQQRITSSLEYIERDSVSQFAAHIDRKWTPQSLLGDNFASDAKGLTYHGFWSARSYGESIAQLAFQLVESQCEATSLEAAKTIELGVASMRTLVAAFSHTMGPEAVVKDFASALWKNKSLMQGFEPINVYWSDVVPIPGWKVYASASAVACAGVTTGFFKWLKDTKTWIQRQTQGKYYVDDSDDWKWIVGGATTISMGWLFYRLVTLKTSMHRRIVNRARARYAPLLPKVAEAFRDIPQAPLRQSLYLAQNTYVRTIDEQQRVVQKWEVSHRTANKAVQWFSARQKAATNLLEGVRNVNV